MDKKNNNPEKFAELLAAYRKGHAEKGQFLSYVDRLSAQVRNNTICGSWIAQDGGCSLLIRSIEDGFSLMLCDNTRCYKTIIRRSGTPCGDCFRGTGRRHYDRQRRAASMRSLRYFP